MAPNPHDEKSARSAGALGFVLMAMAATSVSVMLAGIVLFFVSL